MVVGLVVMKAHFPFREIGPYFYLAVFANAVPWLKFAAIFPVVFVQVACRIAWWFDNTCPVDNIEGFDNGLTTVRSHAF